MTKGLSGDPITFEGKGFVSRFPIGEFVTGKRHFRETKEIDDEEDAYDFQNLHRPTFKASDLSGSYSRKILSKWLVISLNGQRLCSS